MSSIACKEVKLMLLALIVFHVAAKSCLFTSPLTLQLVLEYAEWRSWDQVVLFDNISPFSKYSFSLIIRMKDCLPCMQVLLNLLSCTYV